MLPEPGRCLAAHDASGYIPLVRRSFIHRVLSAVLLCSAGFSAPGTALAHGLAHHEEHHDDVHDRAAAETRAGSTLSVPDHEDEHAHPLLEDVARLRIDVSIGVIPPLRVAPSACVVSIAHDAPIARTVVPPGDPHTGPPPRLRAPPTC